VTTPDFIRAQQALAAFDQAKMEIDAAFWSLEDDDEWAFYVHTTLYSLSRKQVYTKLLDALRKYPGTLPLEDIKLLSADSDLLKALRSAYSFGIDSPFGVDPTFHIHVTNSTIGGYFVRYLVIYRL